MLGREKSRPNTEGKGPEGELRNSLRPVVEGLGMSMIELSLFQSRGRNVQVKLVVQSALNRTGNGGEVTGINDCSMVHRAVMPRLELYFPEKEIYLEVSSPGIDRLIKDKGEFVHYIGREIRCFRTDISDWTTGTLIALEDNQIMLRCKDGEAAEPLALPFEIIAKARLSGLPPRDAGG